MNTRILLAVGALTLLPAVGGAWGHDAEPPPDTAVLPELGGLELWPFTGSDFSGDRYDPLNLVLLDVDPREVRQALLGLDGERELPENLPFRNCVWADAMGSEQVAWASPAGWVGGEVQLVCINPSAPSPYRELGDPFRVHLRLYRQGSTTLGAAHFELLIDGTAQHEVLSWDFARDFVALDLGRGGLFPTAPYAVGLQAPGFFRAVLRPIYDYLYFKAGAGELLAFLGLFPVDLTGDVPIPLETGAALVFSGDIALEPVQEKIRTEIDVEYDIVTPRPFCEGVGWPLVHLGGKLRLTLLVHTNPSGKYLRVHRISGTLLVTPVRPIGDDEYEAVGPTEPADIREYHHAILTNHHGQLREVGLRDLEGATPQTLWWRLDVGQRDRYREVETCGP